MLGISINIVGPQGEIWICGLVRWSPWSNSQGKVDKTRNIHVCPERNSLIVSCAELAGEYLN